MKPDHLMFAGSNLAVMVADLYARTGVKPVFGGSHPGNGTHNALMSLGADQYLELIAPDPDQPVEENLGKTLKTAEQPFIRTWAVACHTLEDLLLTAERLGLKTRLIEMSRTPPDGQTLNWRILRVDGHGFGTLFPFFIDWLDSPNPAGHSPAGCTLESLTLFSHKPAELQALMDTFGITGAQVSHIDPATGIECINAVINTPKGRQILP